MKNLCALHVGRFAARDMQRRLCSNTSRNRFAYRPPERPQQGFGAPFQPQRI